MLTFRAVSLALLLSASARALAAPDTRPTVAVLYFDYSGKDGEMAVLRKGLAQMLISDLSALEGVRLVERDRLEAILAELKLGQTVKIDPRSAAKVGRLLGARYMVLGGYFDLMETLRADARVVEVETGKVIQSIGATGKPQDFLAVEQKLSEGIARILSASAPPRTEAPAHNLPRIKPPAQLKTRTALRYSKALEAIDHGDKQTANKELREVVKEQPDFRLATLDIDRLMQ
jgi:TolB-like protein